MTRRRIAAGALALGVLSVLSLGSAGAQTPAPPSMSEREVLQAKLGPDGAPRQTRLYSQLTLEGDGTYTVADPAATTGLRNLHGFRRPRVDDGTATWTVDVRGQEALRTVADYDGDLPVEISAAYALDGEPTEPSDLVGRSGRLTVTYTVRNVSGVPTELEYKDAFGVRQTETVDIPIPLAGQFTSTLNRDFADVVAEGGVVAGDGRGNTRLSWTVILFEPLGATEQELTYSANVRDMVLPPATLQVVPVTLDQPPLSSGNAAFSDAADSTYELTQGATELDRNVLRLATGASQLLDGLVRLSDGAQRLSTGLGEASSGSQQLADGAARADDGGRQLADGARQLSDGLGEARSKLVGGIGEARTKLVDGTGKLSDGLSRARAGGAQLAEGLQERAVPGTRTLADVMRDAITPGAEALAKGLKETAAPGAQQINTGLKSALGGVGGERDTAANKTVIGGLNDILGGLQGDLATGTGALQQLSAGLAGSFGPDAAAGGANAGQKAQAAADGAQQLGAGAGDLGAGINAIKGQSGAIPGMPHLDYSAIQNDLLCLDDTGPAVGPNILGPGHPGIPIPKGCFTDGVAAAIGFGDMATLNAALSPLGVTVSSAKLAPLDTFLTQLRTGALTIQGGLSQLQAGLQAQADSLGQVWPTCPQAIAAAQGGSPNGLEVIKALECISGSVDDGLNNLVIPGLTQIRGGVSNPLAFRRSNPGYNPDCKPATAQNGLQPCGLRQGLMLLEDGSGRLADGLLGAAEGAGTLAGGLGQATKGAGDIADGIAAAGDGAGQLADGLVQLDDGGKELAAGTKDGLGQLYDGAADGLAQLDEGGKKVANGNADLSDGLGQLRDGTARLSDGLGTAADGSTQLSDGLGMAKLGGQRVADGSQQLSEKGTKVLAGAVNEGNIAQNRNVALIRAMDERSQSGGMPVGAPEGAQASAVYSFELAAADSTNRDNALRLGLFAVALLAMAGVGLLRRRLLPVTA
ncbi:MAG TPA: hypothetical protein VM307_16140 [Egibacteraceae bacterium]|nr:hypothetical protein [Egibacteraceae bacterium]